MTSKGVIDGTSFDVHEYVRFYFRPLTPTQYRNEGVKSRSEADEYEAHCPVPVFLLFDADILEDEGTIFTYESLASRYYVERYSSIDDFIKAPFRDIYHTGPYSTEDRSRIIKRRHAEVLIKDSCNLSLLRWIVCRTQAERETLINLMDETARRLYQDKIKIINKDTRKDMFYYDKLMVDHVIKTTNQVTVNFNRSDTMLRNVEVYLTDSYNTHLSCWLWFETSLSDCMTEENKVMFDTSKNIMGNVNRFTIYIDGHLIYQSDYYIN